MPELTNYVHCPILRKNGNEVCGGELKKEKCKHKDGTDGVGYRCTLCEVLFSSEFIQAILEIKKRAQKF